MRESAPTVCRMEKAPETDGWWSRPIVVDIAAVAVLAAILAVLVTVASDGTGGRRALQPGDRRSSLHEPGHGQDPREQGDASNGATTEGPSRHTLAI